MIVDREPTALAESRSTSSPIRGIAVATVMSLTIYSALFALFLL